MVCDPLLWAQHPASLTGLELAREGPCREALAPVLPIGDDQEDAEPLELGLGAGTEQRCVRSFILPVDRWDPTASSLLQSQTPQLASFPLFCQE